MLLESATTVFSSTILSDRLMTTSTARFLFRPTLDNAIWAIFAPFRLFLQPCFGASRSVYRTASMGETLPAIRAGFKVLINTVTRANRAEPIKIRGLGETDIALPA
ncbi:hypothetical protein SDC9_103224 [bioreactor metagenome]|uniref:Uncharacterized protein n=1 Tax=bioreactor metagenome TaxID=1076179 RepID=A0A645AVS8_9ZZZZ